MQREIESRRNELGREIPVPTERSVGPSGRERVTRELPGRNGQAYRISTDALKTLAEIGRFRAIHIPDLIQHRYAGNHDGITDLKDLLRQGLIAWKSVAIDPKEAAVSAVFLTKAGKQLAESNPLRAGIVPGQQLWSQFVKPREIRHDAALYRLFQAERGAIERGGGTVTNVVLDYQIKQRLFPERERARRTMTPEQFKNYLPDLAEAHGLKMICDTMPIPDLRIEYSAANGEQEKVDLELATKNYHCSHLKDHAEAGFKTYAIAEDHAALSKVWDAHDITGSILSL
ncbi:MAG: hypothetical protein M3Y27_13615 [Acidobacteriota bacterium]|nr:hypothetical protein [Acidobacteriota bacterium]